MECGEHFAVEFICEVFKFVEPIFCALLRFCPDIDLLEERTWALEPQPGLDRRPLEAHALRIGKESRNVGEIVGKRSVQASYDSNLEPLMSCAGTPK